MGANYWIVPSSVLWGQFCAFFSSAPPLRLIEALLPTRLPCQLYRLDRLSLLPSLIFLSLPFLFLGSLSKVNYLTGKHLFQILLLRDPSLRHYASFFTSSNKPQLLNMNEHNTYIYLISFFWVLSVIMKVKCLEQHQEQSEDQLKLGLLLFPSSIYFKKFLYKYN